jgi:integrase
MATRVSKGKGKTLFNRECYQDGSFRQKARAKGPKVWEFRYYITIEGERVRRQFTLGTIDKLPTEALARKAAEAMLLKINSSTPLRAVPRFGAVIERYMEEEKPDRYSTLSSYRSYIKNQIMPKWGDYPLDAVKAMVVEAWLKQLILAPKTKSHIKSLMHSIFEAAQRWELIEIGKNPMALVRVKGGSKRQSRPPILSTQQFENILGSMPDRYRLMVLIAQCVGLRVSEIMGLQWGDFDFEAGTLLIRRGVVHGRVGETKTEYSRDAVPLDSELAAVMLEWRKQSTAQYAKDWVFQNPVTGKPYHQEQIQKDYLKAAGKKAGLNFSLGWHTFRHTYRSWLDETGAPMSVQQGLMRHASIHTTMNVYGQAMPEAKRDANARVVKRAMGDAKMLTVAG